MCCQSNELINAMHGRPVGSMSRKCRRHNAHTFYFSHALFNSSFLSSILACCRKGKLSRCRNDEALGRGIQWGLHVSGKQRCCAFLNGMDRGILTARL